MTGVVVVGVDGSHGSLSALEFAVRDAARRRARLRIVAAVRPPEFWTSYGPVPVPASPAVLDAIDAAARTSADATAERLRVTVPVEVETTCGAPARVLVDAARDADLLVLGHRGRGLVGSAVLGSVGLHCVLHARCPVTIVRPVEERRDELDPVTAMAAPAPAQG